MGFSTKQVKALKRNPDHRRVRTREFQGRTLTYLEGWFAVSEANRIFGFDGWSRETVETRCVLAREHKGNFTAIYVVKVRLTVYAENTTLIREGHGSAEARGDSLGSVHDTALKAAETDASKRALATFGRPFGLELYRSDKPVPQRAENRQLQTPTAVVETIDHAPRSGFHPDDTTPIPRPSHYYGRPQDEITEHFRQERQQAERDRSKNKATTTLPTDVSPTLAPIEFQQIDKSQLTIGEPKRLRDKGHLRFVASQSCLICERRPSDPHHLRFAQPRALGMKVSDEFTVPLCRTHHRQLHQVGDERVWWSSHRINPLEIAKNLWERTRSNQQSTNDAIAMT